MKKEFQSKEGNTDKNFKLTPITNWYREEGCLKLLFKSKLHYLLYHAVFCPCSRVVEAAPYKTIVLPATGSHVSIQLREQDMSWGDFLSNVNNYSR